MCIVAAAEARGSRLAGVYCTSPICSYCCVVLDKLELQHGWSLEDPNQATWVHPFARISLGSTISSNTKLQLAFLNLLPARPSKDDVENLLKETRFWEVNIKWGSTTPEGISDELDI